MGLQSWQGWEKRQLFLAEQPKPARERKKTNSLEVRGSLRRGSHWPEPGTSFGGYTWSGQGGRVFWVDVTAIVIAWVDQQNRGTVGLAQKRVG